jgi:hypothetical protein
MEILPLCSIRLIGVRESEFGRIFRPSDTNCPRSVKKITGKSGSELVKLRTDLPQKVGLRGRLRHIS